MKNSLPKKWAVKRTSDDNWGKVIRYLNDLRKDKKGIWVGDVHDYYGYDGRKDYSGTFCQDHDLPNDVVLLSLKEFCQMVDTPQTINTFKFC